MSTCPTISDAIDKSREALENGELARAFNILLGLYFLPTYSGTKLHSVFEFKRFLKYIETKGPQAGRLIERYLRTLDIRMINNQKTRIDSYYEKMVDSKFDVKTLGKKIRVGSIDKYFEKQESSISWGQVLKETI